MCPQPWTWPDTPSCPCSAQSRARSEAEASHCPKAGLASCPLAGCQMGAVTLNSPLGQSQPHSRADFDSSCVSLQASPWGPRWVARWAWAPPFPGQCGRRHGTSCPRLMPPPPHRLCRGDLLGPGQIPGSVRDLRPGVRGSDQGEAGAGASHVCLLPAAQTQMATPRRAQGGHLGAPGRASGVMSPRVRSAPPLSRCPPHSICLRLRFSGN